MADSNANPFAPPGADVEQHGELPGAELRIRYRLRRMDYFVWNLAHQFRMPLMQILVSGIASFIAYESQQPVPAFVTSYALMWAAQIAFIALTVLVSKNRFLLTDYTVELRPDGVYVETIYSRYLHYWPGVLRVAQGPGFVAVYGHSQGAHVIPSRAFADEAHRSQFISVARARCAAA